MVMLETVKTLIGKMVYPVGSLYMNATDATNPGTLLGFGTWAAFGAGQVPVGKAAAGTFATAGATGGAETVTLGVTNYRYGTWRAIDGGDDTINTTFTTGIDYGIRTKYESNTNVAHANLQPYIVVYIWRRTA